MYNAVYNVLIARFEVRRHHETYPSIHEVIRRYEGARAKELAQSVVNLLNNDPQAALLALPTAARRVA